MLVSTESPLYCLPNPAITSLSGAKDSYAPLLCAADAQAERALTFLCEKHHAVGCWQDVPVLCPYLTAPVNMPEVGQLQALGLNPVQQSQFKRLFQGTQERSVRLKGYVGWLLTEPAFLEQMRQLSQRWQEFASERRPLFPLGRIGRYPTPASSGDLSSEVRGFHHDFQVFLDRWGLMQLSSWDLPDPQGPHLPNLLPPGSPALPVHGIHLVLPLHYSLQGDDNLIQQIYAFQRQAVRDLGLDESLAGLPHFQAYAAMFDVLHLERVIRSRLDGSRPPGFVTAMEQAVATTLDCSLASVQKSRKGISACQRGQRSQIPWLRLRVR